MHWGTLGAYPALWGKKKKKKRYFVSHLAVAFSAYCTFLCQGKNAWVSGQNWSMSLFGFPQEADPWDNNLCTSCSAESSRGIERGVEKVHRERRQQVIKHAWPGQLLQWGSEARSLLLEKLGIYTPKAIRCWVRSAPGVLTPWHIQPALTVIGTPSGRDVGNVAQSHLDHTETGK